MIISLVSAYITGIILAVILIAGYNYRRNGEVPIWIAIFSWGIIIEYIVALIKNSKKQ